MKRIPEFILGLVGTVLSFGVGLAVTAFGAIGEEFNAEGAAEVATGGASTFWFSVLALIGTVLLFFWSKIAGSLMLITSVAGLIGSGLLYVFPAIFLVIGGCMAIFRKEKQTQTEGQ